MALIHTTLGDLDESLLDKTEGTFDNKNEKGSWVEYRLKGKDEVIHRSVNMELKQMPPMFGEIQKLS